MLFYGYLCFVFFIVLSEVRLRGIGSLTFDARRSFTGTFFLLPRIVCMCPVELCLELGEYFRSCFVMKIGKVVRYPALIACSSGIVIGEDRDTW